MRSDLLAEGSKNLLAAQRRVGGREMIELVARQMAVETSTDESCCAAVNCTNIPPLEVVCGAGEGMHNGRVTMSH